MNIDYSVMIKEWSTNIVEIENFACESQVQIKTKLDITTYAW